jgi:hypothetical protein
VLPSRDFSTAGNVRPAGARECDAEENGAGTDAPGARPAAPPCSNCRPPRAGVIAAPCGWAAGLASRQGSRLTPFGGGGIFRGSGGLLPTPSTAAIVNLSPGQGRGPLQGAPSRVAR